jgi:hypothetical protein
VAKDLRNVWHPAARRIYRNWLLYMASQRAGRTRPSALNGRSRVSPSAPRWPGSAVVETVLSGRYGRSADEQAASDPTTELGR